MDAERRLQYDQTYMNMALVLSGLSYANRNKVGCIIVSEDGQIISQGFNGMPQGMPNECENVECTCKWVHGCTKTGTPVKDVMSLNHCKDCMYCKLTTKSEVLHAESNAIAKCAKWFASTENATLYVTLSPCIECAKLIVQSGIKRVVYFNEYRNLDGIPVLEAAGIKIQRIMELSDNKVALIDVNSAYLEMREKVKNESNN